MFSQTRKLEEQAGKNLLDYFIFLSIPMFPEVSKSNWGWSYQ